MLRSAKPAVSAGIQKLVDEIVHEETRFILRERRDATRRPITRAVLVKGMEGNVGDSTEYTAITRDISNQGIGLIAQVPWKVGTVARISIRRMDGHPVSVIAKCRYCDNVSENLFLTGWNFISEG